MCSGIHTGRGQQVWKAELSLDLSRNGVFSWNYETGLATIVTTCLTFQSRPDGCVAACSKSTIIMLMSCMFWMHALLHFTTTYYTKS